MKQVQVGHAHKRCTAEHSEPFHRKNAFTGSYANPLFSSRILQVRSTLFNSSCATVRTIVLRMIGCEPLQMNDNGMCEALTIIVCVAIIRYPGIHMYIAQGEKEVG